MVQINGLSGYILYKHLDAADSKRHRKLIDKTVCQRVGYSGPVLCKGYNASSPRSCVRSTYLCLKQAIEDGYLEAIFN